MDERDSRIKELEAQLQRLTASRDEIRRNNKALTKENARLHGEVMRHVAEASLVVQYIAEKTGFGQTEIVRKVCENLDALASGDKAPHGRLRAPFDLPPGRGGGDAEMQCEGLPTLIQDLSSLAFRLHMSGFGKLSAAEVAGHLEQVVAIWHDSMAAALKQAREVVGWKPIPLKVRSESHFRDMSREELVEHCSDIGWMALDLVQHLDFTREMLRHDLRAHAYVRAERMAREIGDAACEPRKAPVGFDVVLLGGNGLERL